MNYEESLEYLQKHRWMGSVYGIDNMIHLIDILEHPELKLNIVHIAGTNGKGSTVAGLTSILTNAGYTVGSYTSPEVTTYLSRFQINGKPVSQDSFAKAITTVANACRKLSNLKIYPTVFEMELAASMIIAIQHKVDIFLMETGLGGRLDATNVVEKPILSIITSVGYDHQDLLGNRIEEIAFAKSGIIKNGVPLLSWPQEETVNAIFRSECQSHNSEFISIALDDINAVKSTDDRFECFCFNNQIWHFSLLGPHQAINGAGIITTAHLLQKLGYNISRENIEQGLRNTSWPARFEYIHRQPTIILDGAHNPPAMKALCETIEKYLPKKKHIIVLHMFRDKDILNSLKNLSPVIDVLICTSAGSERSLSPEALMKLATDQLPDIEIYHCSNLVTAITTGLRLQNHDDVLIICGSLSHLQEARYITHDILKG